MQTLEPCGVFCQRDFKRVFVVTGGGEEQMQETGTSFDRKVFTDEAQNKIPRSKQTDRTYNDRDHKNDPIY